MKNDNISAIIYALAAAVFQPLNVPCSKLSIFNYIRAQKTLGTAKTSAYYAAAPFIGAFLSFVLLHEELTAAYIVALIVMTAGTALVVTDTLAKHHSHEHIHTFTHTHDGSTHTHTVPHSHEHTHYVT